jgi:hypothetical protein
MQPTTPRACGAPLAGHSRGRPPIKASKDIRGQSRSRGFNDLTGAGSIVSSESEQPKVRVLTSVSFSYAVTEDRIVAVVNAGDSDAWSCWLTRRLVLALLDRAEEFLVTTSALMKQAPSEVRDELIVFEREAAMASTARKMSSTPPDVLTQRATAAELAERLTISSQADRFRVELHGVKEDGAAGVFARAELQRFFQMLQAQAAKADWLGTSKSSAGSTIQATGPKSVRH